MYNYLEAVKNDVMQAIEDNYDLKEYRDNRQELEEKLNDELWTDDSVTGNASGSYTFNTYKAEENLSHNWDLLKEAADKIKKQIRKEAKSPNILQSVFLKKAHAAIFSPVNYTPAGTICPKSCAYIKSTNIF